MKLPRSTALVTVLCFGYGFLYLPVAILSVYSFSASPRAAVWGGFSFRWYEQLAKNPQILDAAILSLKIAAISATMATVLGALAALALRPERHFRGQTGFRALLLAPLILPDIIIGISLLLLFVGLSQTFGWPTRGTTTIAIAHITLSLAYVTVVVAARLARLDPSLHAAATDLGATPLAVFFAITLPLIAPGLAAGWLLAFTLSLDDLVIASFVSGPGASTLPMVIFSKIRLGISPEINALSTLLIALVGGLVVIVSLAFKAFSK